MRCCNSRARPDTIECGEDMDWARDQRQCDQRDDISKYYDNERARARRLGGMMTGSPTSWRRRGPGLVSALRLWYSYGLDPGSSEDKQSRNQRRRTFNR